MTYLRVVIIGGSHAGIAAARHLKRINPATEVIIIEKSMSLGYIGSSLNLYLEGVIDSLEDARSVTPSELVSEQINVLMNSEVIHIDEKKKNIEFVTSNEEQPQDFIYYDYLILAMGSSQYLSEVEMNEKDSVINFKTFSQSKNALTTLTNAKKVAIIGAGLIGFELAETLSQLDKEVYLIDRMSNVLFRYFDEEISSELVKKLPNNVHLILNFHLSN